MLALRDVIMALRKLMGFMMVMAGPCESSQKSSCQKR